MKVLKSFISKASLSVIKSTNRGLLKKMFQIEAL